MTFERPRWQQLAAICSWTSLAVIVFLSWTPRGTVPRTGAPGPVEHILAYACTGVFAGLAARSGRVRWLGLGLVSLAAVLEIGQLWVPGRIAQIVDFSASSAGGVVGLATASWLTGFAFRPPVPSRPVTREPVTGRILLAILVLGLAVTPIWIGFLAWLAARLLAWTFS